MSINNKFRTVADAEKDKFDKFNRAVTTIDSAHRLVHEGMFYQVSGKQTGWLDTTSEEFLIVTPAFTFPHVQVMLLNFGSGDIDFAAYENTTTSADGTPLVPMNVNRNSTNAPDTVLTAGPTITDDGDNIFNLWVPPTGTGVGQSANGVQGTGQGSEWILAPDSKYLIRLTNNSGSTIDWSYEFSWYEIDWAKSGL